MAKLGRPFVYQEGDRRPVTISLRVPAEVYNQIKHYAATHRQSVTEVLLEGLKWRLEGIDVRAQTPDALQDSRDNIQYYYNTVRQQLRGMVEEVVEEALAKRSVEASLVPQENMHTPQNDISYNNNDTVIQESTVGAVLHKGIQHYDNIVIQEETPSPSVPAAALPSFDATKYRLGKLCPKRHEWGTSGQSLRVRNKAGYCLACNAELARAKRQRQSV